MTHPDDAFVIVVRPLPGDAPADVRVRRWLKAGLRGFGLRCVLVRRPTVEELGSVLQAERVPGLLDGAAAGVGAPGDQSGEHRQREQQNP